jgi:hypothetical protein
MRPLAAIVGVLLLSACATTPPDKIFFAPDAADGLVVMEIVPTQASYQIEAASFEPAQSRIESKGYFVLNGSPATRYAVSRAKPGVYALTAVSVQTTWYDCFNGGTVAFEVKPGEVTFLGKLDARPALADIARQLPGYSMNSQKFYVLDTPRPALTAPADIAGWQGELTPFLAGVYPNVTAQTKPAEMKPAIFASGWSLLGQKVCYGYFNRAKDQPDPAKPAG